MYDQVKNRGLFTLKILLIIHSFIDMILIKQLATHYPKKDKLNEKKVDIIKKTQTNII